MSTSTKPQRTTDDLRRLMQKHSAALATPSPSDRPVTASAPASFVAAAPSSRISKPLPSASTSSDRCTIRMSPQEFKCISEVILEVHQRIGLRLTTSDILRIGLARVGEGTPIMEAEVAILRGKDGRRIKRREFLQE